jgi:hypothetical protein
LHTLLDGILIIGGCVAASLLGFALVHRLVPVGMRSGHNDVAGFIYAVVGVMYAILLAYVTIVVWQQFDTVDSTVQLEAVAAGNIYHGVDEFADPMRANVQSMVDEYVSTTIDEEWPLLNQGQISAKADKLAHDLRAAINKLPADTPQQQVMLDHVLGQYETLITERRLRLFQGQVGLHPLLWAMLIVGAVMTIGFTYLFGLESARAHALMIVGLAVVIGGLLFMIQQVNYPFSGDVHVSPEAFEIVRQTFRA